MCPDRPIDDEPQPSPDPPSPPRWQLALLVVLATAALFPLALGASLHCDEFVVLRHVTDFAQGHFRGAGRPGLLWMLMVPATVLADPVLIAQALRVAALLASVGTLCAVFVLAERPGWGRRIAPATGGGEPAEHRGAAVPWLGLASVLLLLTSMDWHGHAFEIRTDTFVVPLTLVIALWLWRTELSLRRAAAVGALVAVIGLFSQKSIYNAVGLDLGWVVVICVGLVQRRVRLGPLLRAVTLATVVAGVGVLLWYGLMALLQSDTGFVSHQFSGAVRTAFTETPFEDKKQALGLALGLSPLLWGCAAVGLLMAGIGVRGRPQLAAVGVLSLCMLATIFVHRGFFMYYIASFEPYLALLGGAALGGLCRGVAGRLGTPVAAALLVVVIGTQVGFARGSYSAMLATNSGPQFSVMRAAREAFPEPVPYWDNIGMMPTYTETTFFGTALSRRWFREATGRNGLIERAKERKPRFFIRNYMNRRRYLHPSERRWLWTHFLPYRPNLYLHGGRMNVGETPRKMPVDLHVAGDYTVWFRGGWQGSASVDDEPVQHGEVITLAEGRHNLVAQRSAGAGQLWLLLGRDRRPLTEHTREQVDYSMFGKPDRQRYQQYDDKRKEVSDLRTPDHDPQIARVNEKKRHRRHSKWQEWLDRKDGRP
jgi:hypothetical protein